MKIARVAGTVVAPIHHPSLDGARWLLCDLLDPADLDGVGGASLIALDTVDAGVGDTVLILDEGTSARQILGLKAGPIRALVVGVVDTVTLEGDAR